VRALAVVAVLVAFGAGCSGEEEAAVPAPEPTTLRAGEERDFAAGSLRVGDVVACLAAGIRAEVAVPAPRKHAFVTATRAWKRGGSTAQIRLEVRRTGRVVAACST
jgi:hypothetical protein